MVTAMVDTDNELKKEVLVRLGLGAGVLGTIVALRALALEERGSRVAILDSGQLWGTGLRWYIWWCVWLRRRKFCCLVAVVILMVQW
ncbi:putative pollen-specific leucine-rich repeat extensin-like protein 3 [Iris pallida]|uniref:Pollen-specific leucine-rich repeat extensin-like protein 3 n=1 Tax=Iris pallida TaxID=29817 RepID=A0AAX6IM57_IRIPA|nr:putative pollen-specific leucine-rich repeat extensin-like protein 3 [Iris pallida]